MAPNTQSQHSIRIRHLPEVSRERRKYMNCVVGSVCLCLLLALYRFWPKESAYRSLGDLWGHVDGNDDQARLIRRYNIHSSVRWMNPDGGRWRVMFVCNGESPCPTLYAQEGDLVELSVMSDIYAQSSIHWSGIGYNRTGSWNDGTAGLSQFPILPRGNYTSIIDTTGSWGLNWYAEHTTAASADGLYGMVYVAPSPVRPRPYRLITRNETKLRAIMEAENEIRHLAIKNHQHRDTGWKLLRMRAEGTEFHCYDSILVNGKGRVHCRQEAFDRVNGQKVDETGCVQPIGQLPGSCTPSNADYEVILTHGRDYIMMNLINIGFEHSLVVSIDNHKMIVVATNGGFVYPTEADVVYVPSAGRITVLVRLDAEPGDYAIRLSSTSQLQNLQGYSILRYPASRRPIYGEPMKLPEPSSPDDICVLPDGSTRGECSIIKGQDLPPFPPAPPPRSSYLQKSSADYTFRLRAGCRQSSTEPHVTEYFLNEQPWQLFRSSLTPLLFQDLHNSSSGNPVGKPVIDGIPIGSVVDLVIENDLNDTIPLYKHGDPAWLIGTEEHARFPYKDVEEGFSQTYVNNVLNLRDPALVTVHDLPPLGWAVLRFKVTDKAATMIHAVKLRYFALGMSAPILEGILPESPASFPMSAADRPHVDFQPKNDGVFG
ncbi:Cupredoxin [Coniella lustricola]|uniref:Cupredoxin n=1 Tax=Coniella lustricola TaxID=2025994 RepID=A0A2T2ZYG5_9PEZI|nr:Cupredoxin [Coniella lustricola]